MSQIVTPDGKPATSEPVHVLKYKFHVTESQLKDMKRLASACGCSSVSEYFGLCIQEYGEFIRAQLQKTMQELQQQEMANASNKSGVAVGGTPASPVSAPLSSDTPPGMQGDGVPQADGLPSPAGGQGGAGLAPEKPGEGPERT